MKENLRNNLLNPTTLFGLILLIGSMYVTDQPYLIMLTAAQIIFIPLLLRLIIGMNRFTIMITWLSMLSVFLLQVGFTSGLEMYLALIYVFFTFFVALNGLKRFVKRGFTNWAEISIDVGMMYLFIGGLWFFAYVTGIDTGFGTLITWLTAIHFHYSAFLLPVSLGFFGRLHRSTLYQRVVPILLAGPMLVAIGITFWPLLEVLFVLFYIVAIYTLIILAFRTRFATRLQARLIRVSYGSLGVTILFSMMYALGRGFGNWSVSIDFMLMFHGLINCVFFGMMGVIGWVASPPASKGDTWTFPVSNIRGRFNDFGESHPGLVDNLNDFVETESLPDTIVHFYKHTEEYKLRASVKWANWFKPLAWCYKLISERMQQLNLPLSSKMVDMTGQILTVDPSLDGRHRPRAWVRRVKNSTVFVAIYSQHESNGRTYMNIALPLPFSSMIGILQLCERNNSLILTSEGQGDAGIYLAVGKNRMKLPLSEHFLIQEKNEGSLTALHKMKISGVHFLKIDYWIERKR
ncbi:YndJ family protein [Rossellomorea aquimaris]|uniref:YndJ family protein n=1 Tax=Rossellomorea aquimaris TaxID=189382 RepID=UPI001CD21F54|nr:YndJ family protein [Rossellomorea aquimaris]MCA1054119.1 YndJ family protein [Rossellomorea aquimaris]